MKNLRFKKGSAIRICGKAGIGKTSLVLQICNEIMNNNDDYKLTIADNELSISLSRIPDIFEKDNYKKITYTSGEYTIKDIYTLLSLSDNNLIFIDAIHLINESELIYLDKILEVIKNTNNILIFTSQLSMRIEAEPICRPFIDRELIDLDIIMDYNRETENISVSYNDIYILCKPSSNFIFDKKDIEKILYI